MSLFLNLFTAMDNRYYYMTKMSKSKLSRKPKLMLMSLCCVTTAPSLLIGVGEEAFDEGFGVEGGEVVGLFAGADEEDGEVEFVGDGEDYAAL